MARITRRKLLKLSGAGAVAAKTGGLAAILATGRAPAYAQTTTVHWLRWNDFVPACDQLLRQKILPEAEKAARHQGQLRDGQRQRPAAAHHLGDPVGRRARPASCSSTTIRISTRRAPSTCRDVAEEIGKDQGGWYPVSKGNCSSDRQVDLDADRHHRRHERLPQILVRRGRLQRVPEDLGRVPRRRQEAEGQGPADRPGARPVLRRPADLRLSADVVLRRHGGRRQGRGRRSTRRRRSRP